MHLSRTTCYISPITQAPLNAIISGGIIEWEGDSDASWQPESVCVDWKSSNFAVLCNVAANDYSVTKWNLKDCEAQLPCALEA